METHRVRLIPRTGFLNELPRSDTIFGALCWGYRMLYPAEFPDFIASFRACPPSPRLLVSSAFPYLCENHDIGLTKDVNLLPRPMHAPPRLQLESLDDVKRAKQAKRVRWVSESIFEKMLPSSFDGGNFVERIHAPDDWEHPGLEVEHGAVQIGTVIYEQETIRQVFYGPSEDLQRMDVFDPLLTQTRMRHAEDRVSGGVNLGQLFSSIHRGVRGGTGIYFLVRSPETETPRIKSVLNYLADTGIGGDLSVGKGCYRLQDIQEATGIFTKPMVAREFVTLSLLCLSAEQLRRFSVDDSYYELVARKGKVDSRHIHPDNPWKKTQLAFGEGSRFVLRDDVSPSQFYGMNPIVSTKKQNGHFDVQMFGFAFPVAPGEET